MVVFVTSAVVFSGVTEMAWWQILLPVVSGILALIPIYDRKANFGRGSFKSPFDWR